MEVGDYTTFLDFILGEGLASSCRSYPELLVVIYTGVVEPEIYIDSISRKVVIPSYFSIKVRKYPKFIYFFTLLF